MKKIIYIFSFFLIFISTSYPNENSDILISKDIEVVPIKKSNKIIQYIYTHKKEYKVKELIRFVLKLKKKAYIYILNISKRNKKAYLILPNEYQKYNLYKANIKYVIPTKNDRYNFISDSPGEEIVYVVASEKKLTNLPSFKRFKETKGIFREATAKEGQEAIKDIKVVENKNYHSEIVKIIIPVKPKIEKEIFISTGRYTYQQGEPIDILIKSNSKGYISLYLEDESKKVKFLKKLKFDKTKGKQFYLNLEQKGTYHLIAIFSDKNKNPNISCLTNLLNAGNQFVSECVESYVYNIHQFLIK